MRKVILSILNYFFGLSFIFGCSCDTMSFEEATKWADEIFMGRLIELKETTIDLDPDGLESTRIWSAKFKVSKKWKGNEDRYVEIFQPHTSCDYLFDFPSHPYLVYAKYTDFKSWDTSLNFKGLSTWLCTRTADAATYNKWIEDGFDDRGMLDQRFPKEIKLNTFDFKWEWLICILLFLTLLWLVYRTTFRKKKYTNIKTS